MLKKTFIILFALCLVTFPAFGEKPEPPPQFLNIFKNISALESAITSGKWHLAEEKSRNVEALLDSISFQIIKSLGQTKYDHLLNSLHNLRDVLKTKDSSVVFDQLLLVEKLLFQTMESFNYFVLPAIIVINEHINEAVTADSKNDYEKILHEMEEVAIIIEDASDKLVTKGIGKGMQEDMLNLREVVISAISKQDSKTLSIELKRMKNLSRAFIWIGRQSL